MLKTLKTTYAGEPNVVLVEEKGCVHPPSPKGAINAFSPSTEKIA